MSRVPSGQDPERQQLEDVIKTSTIKRLETVLLEICNESPEAFKLACDKLFVKEERVGHAAVSLLQGPLEDNSAFKVPRARKRGRRYEMCEQCDQEYDVLKEEVCVWHPGDLELDEDDENDFWADWDEACHGEMDTDFNREEYPEGFVWSCCQGRGDAKGCMMTAHEQSKAKRSRV